MYFEKVCLNFMDIKSNVLILLKNLLII